LKTAVGEWIPLFLALAAMRAFEKPALLREVLVWVWL